MLGQVRMSHLEVRVLVGWWALAVTTLMSSAKANIRDGCDLPRVRFGVRGIWVGQERDLRKGCDRHRKRVKRAGRVYDCSFRSKLANELPVVVLMA